MKLTISQLRVLEAVARTGSFSKAAKDLGITQPSVSTQLRTLETQSRSRILARDGHRVTPTRLGALILPKVRALVTVANELERILAEARDLERGVLRIGYSTHQFAIPVISRFMKAHPGIKLEARSMASLDLIDLLDRGVIDAAFITAQTPPPRFSCVQLLRDEIVLMIPAAHELADAGDVGWGALADLPLIRREETSATRQIFDRAAAAAGASPNTVLDLGSWGSLKSAVIAGIGGCVALLGEIEPDPRVAVLRISDSGLWAGHHLAATPEMREVAAVEALFAMATGPA
ncbi:MAG: LysR substrate-binding domain-containing protein [Pikeienuella sp.]